MSPSGIGIASVNTMVTGRAVTLMTADGGLSWVSRELPLPHVSIYDQVSEGSPEYQGGQSFWLWVSLFNNHTDKQRWLFEHTTNGGKQWSAIPWNQSIPPANTIAGSALWFLPQKTLFFVADSQGTEIWQWIPDDMAWHQLSHLPVDQIKSVSLLPNGDGWVIGDTSSYQTINGGATWRAFSPHIR